MNFISDTRGRRQAFLGALGTSIVAVLRKNVLNDSDSNRRKVRKHYVLDYCPILRGFRFLLDHATCIHLSI